ncbi:hypothetical protein PFLUV_G00127980 [Perca fluviatilis]|uniref:FAST kinase leucine-rich domain-containing protein n=1 Tax=Perca fluviatilis TaxID=8168 RepID=A0A6A5EV78_PERFL|nr:hypothetical protein PFLUV_G00127980 [Perca fluviatilis]
MYATRLYSPAGGGGGAGGGVGGVKQGRRAGLAVLEAPHHLPHHPHPAQPPPSFPLYQGRPDAHRGAHFHPHYHPHPHPQPAHLAPPPLPSHYQHHAHYHSYGGGAQAARRQQEEDVELHPREDELRHVLHHEAPHRALAAPRRGPALGHAEPRQDLPQPLPGGPAEDRTAAAGRAGASANAGAGAREHAPAGGDTDAEAARGGAAAEGADGRQVLEHQDFQTLCNAIVNDCAKFDNFSIVNCLYAVAALGLPSDSAVVQVLEAESQSRLNQFNQKDVSMVFSSSMKLHPGSQHALTEACLAGLEKNLERERHPQTLFLLLSYYRLKLRSLQTHQAATGAATGAATAATTAEDNSSTPPNPEQLLANRKILRLVKHTLASVSGVRDQEMALLDEMLAACVREASNKSLELIFSSHLFYQNRQERFISSLAEELPKKVDSITPYTMALIAKYIARHRLRETRLLDTVADFLVKKAEYLDSKLHRCPDRREVLPLELSGAEYRTTNLNYRRP